MKKREEKSRASCQLLKLVKQKLLQILFTQAAVCLLKQMSFTFVVLKGISQQQLDGLL